MGLLILLLASSAYGQLNKLTLSGGGEIRNTTFIQVLDDSLVLKASGTSDLKRVALDDMERLLITRGAHISRIDMGVLSTAQKVEVLTGLINERTNAEASETLGVSETIDPLIYFLLGGLIIVLLALWRLLRRRPSQTQGAIPGVEEMAQTAAFWSEWHQGRVGNERVQPEDPDKKDPKSVE